MGDRSDVPNAPRHGEAGFLLWDKVLATDLLPWFPDGRRLVPLARAIFGHHGTPVAERLPTTVTQAYRPYGLAAARAFARDAANLLLSGPIRLDQGRLVKASFAIAGVAVVADWVGSSAAFAYRDDPIALATYWRDHALEPAKSAIRQFGLVPCPSARERSLPELMGDNRFSDRTPMQLWASDTPDRNDRLVWPSSDSQRPGLVIPSS
jgi:CRISPR-associated endonuclease/helicase Cas3